MIDKSLMRFITVLLFYFILPAAHPQAGGLSFDLPHPKKYENRQLRAEKTGDKKFTIPRRFMQNTTTHYNFFFNANEKLKEVVDRAKSAHRDDYTKLLSFHNYTIDETARFKNELDSVIYKATAGILLHDLRNNWVDNLYLLMGEAYYYKKDFDSAYLTFQYLNYAFSPKEKDGYDKVIGSNSNEGGNAFSISTSEKRNIAAKVLSRPPSRNESLLWQVNTYLALDALPEARSLIQTLKADPLFPARLDDQLNRAQAWYFYKNQDWDSTAFYLQRASGTDAGREETARREYLIAQCYEAAGKHGDAKNFYEQVVKHTINPVMEVYGLLNSIRQGEGNDEKAIQAAVDALAKMGKRDKYISYRDIIFYTAAQIELDRHQPAAAKDFLVKSIRNNNGNPAQKNRSYLALANLEFADRNYIAARNDYDSTDLSLVLPEEADTYKSRKAALAIIASRQEIINRQDSLRKIAAMPEADRTAYIKKLLRQLRKQQGLKEDDVSFGNSSPGFAGNNNTAPADLFTSSSSGSGEWYFSNSALKSKGYTAFKSLWGSRPNADNWQRAAAIKQQAANPRNPGDPNNPNNPVALNGQAAVAKPLTVESLTDNLPLTPEKLRVSDDSVMHARYDMAKALQDYLEAYPDAIVLYEGLLNSYPRSAVEENTLFNLFYCYKKTGQTAKMEAVKDRLAQQFPNSKLAAIAEHPAAVDSGRKKEGGPIYNQIYTLFIEGNFAEAVQKKKSADSLYGNYYWSPQLLYIEAVYDIHARYDSAARLVLNNIITFFPASPMAAKAKTLIDVLGRRKQIEEYLTTLKIERLPDDSLSTAATASAPVAAPRPPVTTTAPGKPASPPVTTLKDSAAVQKTAVSPAVKPVSDSNAVLKKSIPPPPAVNGFTAAPDQPHYVVLVMNKVDPVYVGEAGNAFNRYNREKFYNQTISITPLPLTDTTRFVLMGTFANAAAAINYLGKTRPLAASEIIPWMPASKYDFIIITEANLEVLKNSKDVPAYKKFLIRLYKDAFK